MTEAGFIPGEDQVYAYERGEFFDVDRQERRDIACPGGPCGERGGHAPCPGPAGRGQGIGRLLAGVFQGFKEPGLSSETVVLGVMDGLAGLEMVFREEFPHAEVQRCQVHVVRNVLAKVPKRLKQEVADDMRSIFYASSKEKAEEFLYGSRIAGGNEVPSAVKCLENSVESYLTFFKFPPQEWQALRTTNIIERLNKEFKRRIKSMEIGAGENDCYQLLAFISLKMEVHWKRNPIGKVAYNLPIFKRVPLLDFT